MQKYLVTGGSGFIGSALVRALLANGDQVRVFDDNSRGNPSRLKDISNKIEPFSGDIRDLSQISKAMAGIDVVFHLAAVNGTEFFYSRSELVLDVGVKGICNVLDAAIEHKVKKLVVASSAEVYQTPLKIPTPEQVPLIVPDPLNRRYSYGGSKIISELMAINYSHNFEQVLIFRPHNIYGPDMGNEHVIPQILLKIKKLLANSPSATQLDLEIQGNGQETRAFCYIEDLINGLLIMLQNSKSSLDIYHIGTMEEVSIVKLIDNIGMLIDRKINILPGELTTGSTLRRCPDIAKISQLGFAPKFSLIDGLRKTLDFYLGVN